jgi:integrase
MGDLIRRGRIWWVRYYRDGRRYQESSGSQKEGDARRLLRLREGDVERGLPVSPKIGRLRFEEAAQDLINDYKVNGRKSLADIETRITMHLAPYFGGRRMSAITTSDVRAYIAERKEATVSVRRAHAVKNRDGSTRQVPERRVAITGASNGEINRELTALKRMFRLAMQAGKLLVVPHVPMLKENNVRTGFFEREQFEAVRRYLPEYAQPIVTFAYYTGWRIESEVLTLQWRQIDEAAGTVRLDAGTTKNSEGRVFVYSLVDELRRAIDGQRTSVKGLREKDKLVPWVFHRPDGDSVKSFRFAWNEACRQAGCPGRLLHDFRRTAVRNLVRAGVPERVAMAMTGHKTRSVFERYNIVSESDLLDASAKLGKFTVPIAREA